MNSFSKYDLGLFMESDFVSLSTRLTVQRGYLIDGVTGAKHRLHYLTEAALRPLAKGITFHKWLHYMLDEQLDSAEIAEIILFVNGIGGFRLKRSKTENMKRVIKSLKNLGHGLKSISLIVERPASWRYLIEATSYAGLPVVMVSLIACLILYGSGFMDSGPVAWAYIAFLSSLFASALAHEYTHIWIVRKVRQPLVIIRGGLRLGVLHGPLGKKTEMYSAILGPLIGATVGLIVAIIFWITLNQGVILTVGLSVSMFHLISLLPTYSDGRSLANIWREKRYGQS